MRRKKLPKPDGRQLSHETLEEIRIRAVQRVEAGEDPIAVIDALGMSRPCIYKWMTMYREGGIDALRARRIPGRPHKLTGQQLQLLVRTLVEKSPLQMKFEFALWTRELVRELIRDKWGVRMSGVAVGRLLHKLGFSPQKPLRRAYEQDAAAARDWVETTYPQIAKLAKTWPADIYFGDEAGVRTDYHAGTSWAPVGMTPVIPAMGARESINLVSAISARGKLRFMAVKGTMTGAKFVEFLKRLLHGSKRNVFLIVDGHGVHRSAEVKRFVASTKGKLRIFFLPPYSPELNPDELVWNDLKTNGVGRRALRQRGDLKRNVLRHLRSLQRSPRRIKAFFREPNVRYAAN